MVVLAYYLLNVLLAELVAFTKQLFPLLTSLLNSCSHICLVASKVFAIATVVRFGFFDFLTQPVDCLVFFDDGVEGALSKAAELLQ